MAEQVSKAAERSDILRQGLVKGYRVTAEETCCLLMHGFIELVERLSKLQGQHMTTNVILLSNTAQCWAVYRKSQEVHKTVSFSVLCSWHQM